MPAKSEKEHRYYLIKPFVKRIKTWVSRHLERVGMPATVVNAQGQAPRADQGVQRNDGGAVRLPGSSAMSVQELFQAVNRERSPHASMTSVSAHTQQTTSAYPQHVTSVFMQPAGIPAQAALAPDTSSAATALLQTLMGSANGTQPASGGSSSGVGPEPLQPAANDKLAALANLMRRTGITSTPPPQQQQAVFGSGSPDAQAVAAMPAPQHFERANAYGSRPSSTANVGSPLQGFAFDTASIMNAFTNPNS
ncbi:hypothetical protein IWW50_002529 [Coemansia erecta]|nr:hypothetical protein IWW50_002529 [Coemansia erecta]